MLSSELQYYRSVNVTADGTNGGRMSHNVITSGVEQNVWPNVPKAERDAGSDTFRKLFHKANSNDNASLDTNHVFIDIPTTGDDWIVAFAGTDTDTQADLVVSARKYGVGTLKTDVTAGTATAVVTVEDVTLTTGNDQIFIAGDTVRITDKVTPDAVSGNEEDRIIDSVSFSGNDATIVFTTNLANSYAAATPTRVSTKFVTATVIAATDDFVVTAAGDLVYDDVIYPPVLNNRGAVTQVFTLTFTDAVNYSVTGDSLTGLPSGNINTDYAAPNPNFSGTNYLELEYLGFSGTPQAGDTIVITVSQAAIPVWYKRVVPPLCGSLANNKTTTAWSGESV